jgi:hypothetical protein
VCGLSFRLSSPPLLLLLLLPLPFDLDTMKTINDHPIRLVWRLLWLTLQQRLKQKRPWSSKLQTPHKLHCWPRLVMEVDGW